MALLDKINEAQLDDGGKSSPIHQHDEGTVKTKNLSPRPGERSIPWSALKGRLFDRERQKDQLMGCYERIMLEQDNSAAREIALVTGPSGTGKTVLAQWVYQAESLRRRLLLLIRKM
jgi:hypothetical protein